jgi:hypothetical protein
MCILDRFFHLCFDNISIDGKTTNLIVFHFVLNIKNFSGKIGSHGLVQHPDFGSPELTDNQRGITPTAAPPVWVRQRRCTANIRARRTAWNRLPDFVELRLAAEPSKNWMKR